MSVNNDVVQCPCNTDGIAGHMPDFFGSDYYCESGIQADWQLNTLYVEDPLWDNENCRTLETACCNVSHLPYFYKDFESPSYDDIV